MRQLRLGLAIAILSLAGCNTIGAAPPPPPTPVALQISTPNATAYFFRPVARVVSKGSMFVPEGGGYAVVLLRRGPSGRGAQACAKMIQSMGIRLGPADGRAVPEEGVPVFERPVYWPVTVPTPANCAAMLRNYDFDRATTNLQRIPNWSRLGRGPFVVVRRQSGNQAGLFDFSNVVAEDFEDQFAAVVNYMSQRPDVWTTDFYRPANVRQRMRYYVLERAGEGPMVIANLFNLNGGEGG